MSHTLAPDPSATITGTGASDIDQHAHLVQFYEQDTFLLEEITRFIGAGLGAGDAAVVIVAAAAS